MTPRARVLTIVAVAGKVVLPASIVTFGFARRLLSQTGSVGEPPLLAATM